MATRLLIPVKFTIRAFQGDLVIRNWPLSFLLILNPLLITIVPRTQEFVRTLRFTLVTCCKNSLLVQLTLKICITLVDTQVKTKGSIQTVLLAFYLCHHLEIPKRKIGKNPCRLPSILVVVIGGRRKLFIGMRITIGIMLLFLSTICGQRLDRQRAHRKFLILSLLVKT